MKADNMKKYYVNQLSRCTFWEKSSDVEHRAEGLALDKIVVIMAERILNKNGNLCN